jgi:hypothetical protein
MQAMDSAQHIVKLGTTLTAVELVDRTMIELALANPAFAPTVRNGADRPAGCHPAGGIRRCGQGRAAEAS